MFHGMEVCEFDGCMVDGARWKIPSRITHRPAQATKSDSAFLFLGSPGERGDQTSASGRDSHSLCERGVTIPLEHLREFESLLELFYPKE